MCRSVTPDHGIDRQGGHHRQPQQRHIDAHPEDGKRTVDENSACPPPGQVDSLLINPIRDRIARDNGIAAPMTGDLSICVRPSKVPT